MSASKIGYETQLDGLRAIAVWGVLLFHLGVAGVDGGFTGVDVFFVLSGYLITAIITKNIETEQFSFSKFYVGRIRRLVPAGLVVIALTTLGAFLLFSVEHFEAHGRAAVHSTLWMPNINFWLESGYFDSDKFTKPLLHFWSLGVEEQFYLFWPLIIFFGLKFGRRILVLILAVLCALSFSAASAMLDAHPSAVFFLTPFRVWQFGIGGLLALLIHTRRAGQTAQHLPAILGLPATILGVVIIGYGFGHVTEIGYPGWQALIPTAGTLLVIAGGANSFSNLILSNGASRFFGRISYSLYLVHWPIIVFWKYTVNRDLMLQEQIVIGAISIGLATALHWFVETPLRKPWSKTPSSENAIVYARISPFILATVLLSSYIWAQDGWKWRLSANALNTANQLAVDEDLNCRSLNVQGFRKTCLFGASGSKPDVIVIGDSQARSLANGLQKTLEESNKTGVLFAANGTLPLKNARTFNTDVAANQNFDDAIEYAIKSDANTVIIHARWALHWSTRRPSGSNKMRKFVGLKGGKPPKTIKKSQTNFKKTLDRTLLAIGNTDKTIIIVGALPYQGADLAQCATRPTYLMSLNRILSSCGGFTREQALARTKRVNAVLSEATSNAGFTFVDPTTVLCPKNERTCLRSVNSEILFRDSNHLSKVGAKFLIDQTLIGIIDD